jgi:hypothetical protein
MNSKYLRPILFVAAAAAACSTETFDGEEKCSGTAPGSSDPVTAEIFSGATDREVSDPVTISGRLTRGDGVTVYRVLVAGVPATNEGVDFEKFSAVLSFDVLTNLSVAQKTENQATIDLRIETNCDEATELPGVVSLKLAPKAGLFVRTLKFDPVEIAGGIGFLPATRSVAARLKLVADPRAAGARIRVVTTLGRLDQSDLTLAGDTMTDAHQELTLTAHEGASGVAVVTAVAANDATAAVEVRIAAPPQLDPPMRSFEPGETGDLSVSVSKDGDLKDCRASGSTSFSVRSGGLDLFGAPVTVATTNGRGVINVVVAHSAGLNERATITCQDQQMQSATAMFVVSAPVPIVDRLQFDPIVYPGGRTFLPANGRDSATLELRANPKARTASVQVRTSFGNIDGSRERTIVLSGNGVSDVEHPLLFSATEAGRALILATSANGRSASIEVKIAGPPAITPGAQSLQPGQTIRAFARSDGELPACRATSSTGLLVTSNGVDLMANTGGTDVNGDGDVDLEIQALSPGVAGASTVITCRDSYGQTSPAATFTVANLPRVDQLAFASPAIPGNAGYLPADGLIPAVLQLTANAEAAGAIVHIAPSFGTVDGLAARDVVLSGNGTGPSSASVLYTSSIAGTAVITASAGSRTAVLSLRVAGPPQMLPGTFTLAAGQSSLVSVDTQGTLDTCQATPVSGLSVTSGGRDLFAGPTALTDGNGDGHPDITVEAASVLTGPVSTTITCRDVFGQSVSGQYHGN